VAVKTLCWAIVLRHSQLKNIMAAIVNISGFIMRSLERSLRAWRSWRRYQYRLTHALVLITSHFQTIVAFVQAEPAQGIPAGVTLTVMRLNHDLIVLRLVPLIFVATILIVDTSDVPHHLNTGDPNVLAAAHETCIHVIQNSFFN